MRCVTCFPWLLVAGLLAFTTGCGPDTVHLTPVHGRVSYQQSPLRGGTIVFTPDADRGNRGPIACAEIQADGSYRLSTGQDLGAVAGWHRVTILASDATGRELPRKYCDPELSGLLREIKSGRENIIELDLD